MKNNEILKKIEAELGICSDVASYTGTKEKYVTGSKEWALNIVLESILQWQTDKRINKATEDMGLDDVLIIDSQLLRRYFPVNSWIQSVLGVIVELEIDYVGIKYNSYVNKIATFLRGLHDFGYKPCNFLSTCDVLLLKRES